MLASNEKPDPNFLRSHCPSWVDDDIRQHLEQLLDPAPNPPQASSSAAASNAAQYQKLLADMAADLRAKQYALQHKQKLRQDLHIPLPSSSHPSPLSSPQRRHAPATPLSASHARSQSQPRRTPGSAMRRPTAAAAALGARGHRGSLSQSSSTSSLATPLSARPPMSPRPSQPLSPRAHTRSRSPTRPLSTSEDSVSVPLEWFEDMQRKIETLAQMGAAPPQQTEEQTSAAELQRMKYALLVEKLDEMNRLHREVLSEEQQKQHIRDLEQLQQQHLREFASRLEAAQAENARLLAERDRERQLMLEQREAERQVVSKWGDEKELALDQLRAHFLEREKVLVASHRSMEAALVEQKDALRAQIAAQIEERDRERRAVEQARVEQSKLLQQALDEKHAAVDAYNKKTLEAESAARQVALLSEENARLRRRSEEASEGLAQLDSLRAQLHRLQADKSEREAALAQRERYWQEQAEEIEAREQRLQRLRHELDEREAARRDARRRERRERVGEARVEAHLVGPASLFKLAPEDVDCAWASGPIDRSLLAHAQTQSQRAAYA